MKIEIKSSDYESTSVNLSVLRNVSVSKIERVTLKEIDKGKYVIRHENWGIGDEITPIVACYSKKDNSYIGDLKMAKYLCDKLGILPERRMPDHDVASIGVSDLDGKIWGWSHRSSHGFKPGDKIKKGDCAYKPVNDPQSILQSVKDFWNSFDTIVELDGDHIVRWSPDYSRLREKYGPNFYYKWKDKDWIKHFGHTNKRRIFKQLKNDGYMIPYKNKLSTYPTGRGEWTLKNWDDARQAASDFAESVSRVL